MDNSSSSTISWITLAVSGIIFLERLAFYFMSALRYFECSDCLVCAFRNGKKEDKNNEKV